MPNHPRSATCWCEMQAHTHAHTHTRCTYEWILEVSNFEKHLSTHILMHENHTHRHTICTHNISVISLSLSKKKVHTDCTWKPHPYSPLHQTGGRVSYSGREPQLAVGCSAEMSPIATETYGLPHCGIRLSCVVGSVHVVLFVCVCVDSSLCAELYTHVCMWISVCTHQMRCNLSVTDL